MKGRTLSLIGVLALGSVLGACDGDIVFRDRELFQQPSDDALGFLGYSDETAGLTACGNCHVGVQAHWAQTEHASAWEGLQASPGAQDFCESCHTVSELGNSVTASAGHSATGESRYQDVQCESCHGPGLTHVQGPGATQPLATLSVGLDLTEGCGECHQGSHHPFAEEWAQSLHSQVVGFAANRPECESCHTGEGALKAWGIETSFADQASLEQPGNHLAITCGVCHDPHGSTNTAQLRFPIDVANEEQNLCMKCHHKRGVPDPTTFRGPHSPEGPTLLGVAGWWPPNLQFPGGSIRATHGSEANPRMCAGCHVNSFEVTDPETGDFVFQATGHLFEATPCLDAQGVPVAGGECADTERTYATCADAGCHGDADVARGLQFTAGNRLTQLAAALEALIAQIPAGEFNPDDDRYTVAEGSQFNVDLARSAGAEVHNPFLIEALLTASITEVASTYQLTAPALDLRNLLSLTEE